MMGQDPREVTITLSGNAVVAPALRAIRDTLDVVSCCLAVCEQSLTTTSDRSSFNFEFTFESDNREPQERIAARRDWILSNGFRDLAKGLRRTLEEADLYLSCSKLNGRTTWGELQNRITELRSVANAATFPALLQRVNERLTTPLHFETEFASLNKVRNCLEHRGGMVGTRDVDAATGTLVLALPRFKLFHEVDGREIELRRGSTVEKDTIVQMKRVTQHTTYTVGDPILFAAEDFHEIGLACWFFAHDLGSKLPQVQTSRAA